MLLGLLASRHGTYTQLQPHSRNHTTPPQPPNAGLRSVSEGHRLYLYAYFELMTSISQNQGPPFRKRDRQLVDAPSEFVTVFCKRTSPAAAISADVFVFCAPWGLPTFLRFQHASSLLKMLGGLRDAHHVSLPTRQVKRFPLAINCKDLEFQAPQPCTGEKPEA